MIEVGREGECMKLGDLVFLYYLKGICEVTLCLSRKSDDEVGSDIEPDTITSSDGTKLPEHFSQTLAIVVTVHRFQEVRRSRLDRQVGICIDANIRK